MTTMISKLPRDLIEEIISRVPLKSMKAVRLTCKSWNDLLKSESFTKMHIGKAKTTREGETMVIAKTFYNIYLLSVDVDSSVVELTGQLRFLHKEVSISRVFHYEGLLLCTLKDVNKIVVWNPYLAQTRFIDLRIPHRPHEFDMFNFALGYADKESCRSVKFLWFIDYFHEAPNTQFYEIYDFDAGLWTTLDVTSHWGILCSSHGGVSLKGNTYWHTIKRSSSEGLKYHIICFDFTRERFGPLLPLTVGAMGSISDVTLFCVKEEKLAALIQPYTKNYEVEIWITTKIETEMVLWSKFLRIDTSGRIDVSVGFIIDEEKKVFVGFDFFGGYPRTRLINIIGDLSHKATYLRRKINPRVYIGQHSWRHLCSYVPSLVQIKKPSRDKSTKQSSLEEHRFFPKQVETCGI